nr:MAG TPA: hypothetical protein [Caudoviricetes sp.]
MVATAKSGEVTILCVYTYSPNLFKSIRTRS